MILIKTEFRGFNSLFNYNNCACIQIDNTVISIIQNTEVHYLALIENKELREKVYNKIQNKIIELNAKNENGCIDVEAIIKEVMNGNSF